MNTCMYLFWQLHLPQRLQEVRWRQLMLLFQKQDYFSQKIGNVFPTAWEIPPGTVCTGPCAHSSRRWRVMRKRGRVSGLSTYWRNRRKLSRWGSPRSERRPTMHQAADQVKQDHYPCPARGRFRCQSRALGSSTRVRRGFRDRNPLALRTRLSV